MKKAIHKEGNLKFVDEVELPLYLEQGWIKGRGLPAWNKGLTADVDERVKQNREGLMQPRSNWSEERRAEYASKISKALSGRKIPQEVVARRSQTRRGFIPSIEQRLKTSQSLKGHEVSLETRAKLSIANKGRKRGPCSEEWRRFLSVRNSSPKFQAHQLEVKKKNGTLNTSGAEKKALPMLQGLFGVENVLSPYRDSRYPFNCDFYIKSLDLFIELNITWTHGGRPYIPEDPECRSLLMKWREKAQESKYYRNAIYTWTDLDVRKQSMAKKEHLNYLMFYKMKDFEAWFEGSASSAGEIKFPESNGKLQKLKLKDIFSNPYGKRRA